MPPRSCNRCVTVHCADVTGNIVAEFGDGLTSVVLMSDILVGETAGPISACLSLQYAVSSSAVNMSIALSSSSQQNLLHASSQTVTIHQRSCQPARLCHWQETVSVSSGDRLFVTASKLRATRQTVIFAFLANVSLTPGTCSYADTTEGKFVIITVES